jgi:hypothetical protein
MASAGNQNDSPTAAGSKSIRDTAKWLIAAFGALGGALVTSLQLKDLGSLTGSSKLQALAGFAVAILGVVVALLATAKVLSAKVAELQEMVVADSTLNTFIKENPELLEGFDSIDEVYALYMESSRERKQAFLEKEQTAFEKGSQAKIDAAKAKYDYANDRLSLVNPVVTLLIDVGIFEKIRRQWARAIPLVVIGVVLSAAGASIFATADKTATPSTTTAIPPIPEYAVMDLTPSGIAQFGRELGRHCPLPSVGVIVLNSSPQGWDVVTAEAACDTVRFTVPTSKAAIEACSYAIPDGSKTPSAFKASQVARGNRSVIEIARPPPGTHRVAEPATGGPCPPIGAR